MTDEPEKPNAMKQFLLVFLVTMLANTARSQNVGINETGAAPDPSAILHVDSETATKGVIIPRLTTSERDAILNPGIGLTVYNVDTKCFDTYDGVVWASLCPGHDGSGCPSGMVSVGGVFSIESDQRVASSWFDAAQICHALGARLCTVEEFFLACDSGNPSLLNMVGDGEWVSNTGSGNSFRVVGELACDHVSNGTLPTIPFRCCCDH